MMKCVKCVERGLTSYLHPRGHFLIKNLRDGGFAPMITVKVDDNSFYDQDGTWHYHPHEGAFAVYECDRGHEYSELITHKCDVPGCDFTV